MVFKEDLPDLYFAFHDWLAEDGKEQHIIKCKICCLEVPSHSTRSEVCEMCFDVDFWNHHQELKEKRKATMWVIKTAEEGIIGNYYWATNSYWAGRRENGVASLSDASLFKTKDEASSMLRIAENAITTDKPEFKIIQIMLSEVN